MPDPVDGVYALDDWSNRWREGRAGWHLDCVHKMLAKYFDKMANGRSDLKIFVPLCGKAMDMKWMFDQGHRIVGVEYDEKVVKELFEESQIEVADVKEMGGLKLYSSADGRFKVYQGDFFLFKKEYEPEPMSGIWDRGSLVAVNVADREKYASVILTVMGCDCRYLLDTLEYDVSQYVGVPHCVTDSEIHVLYSSKCNIERLERSDALVERWKKQGLTSFHEKVDLITLK